MIALLEGHWGGDTFALFGHMVEIKYLFLVKMKERRRGMVDNNILQGMTKLVSKIIIMMLTQGSSHVISLSFGTSKDLTSYMSKAPAVL
uniref:Uncharacterized protein n=1 Tax=Leersia perrieri TaxID=77586 RepID=A0A0D9XWX6_9ORYZ